MGRIAITDQSTTLGMSFATTFWDFFVTFMEFTSFDRFDAIESNYAEAVI